MTNEEFLNCYRQRKRRYEHIDDSEPPFWVFTLGPAMTMVAVCKFQDVDRAVEFAKRDYPKAWAVYNENVAREAGWLSSLEAVRTESDPE